MSEENVARLRGALEAWSRGDLEESIRFIDSAIEWHTSGAVPDVAPVYHGRDGVREFWKDFRGAWQEIAIVPERVIDLGNDVLVLSTFRGRGREGIEVERKFGNLYSFREGLVVREQAYASWEEALEAVGLED